MKRDDFTAVSPVKQTSLDNSDFFFFTLTNVVYFLLCTLTALKQIL